MPKANAMVESFLIEFNRSCVKAKDDHCKMCHLVQKATDEVIHDKVFLQGFPLFRHFSDLSCQHHSK